MSENPPYNELGFDPQGIRTDVPPAPVSGPVESEPGSASGDAPASRKSQATELVEMALELFQLRVSPDGEAFVVTEDLPHLARPLRGGRLSLRARLSADYFERFERAVSSSALADAISVLEGKAQRLDPTTTHERVARRDGVVYLDLGDAEGHVVRVDGKGWTVESSCPVVFRRTEVGLAMPTPMSAGQLDDLWSLCNVAPEDRPLVLAWLLATFLPDVACPILVLGGEQGCAKSTTARVLASIVDPCHPQLRRPPASDVDWPAVAQVSRVVALDNMSHVSDWLSDSLCRAVTGDGDVRRRLYSDGNVVPFAFQRAILLNGISLGSLRGDLAERTLACTLDVIPKERRRLDAEINGDLARLRPLLLAALLDLLSEVLRALPHVDLPSRPRMADFAVLLAAVDQCLGTRGLDAYLAQLDSRAVDTIAGDPVLQALSAEIESTWTGPSVQLLSKISFHAPDGWERKYWPGTPPRLTQYLMRRAPAMRAAGWIVEQGFDNHRKVARWTITPPSGRCAGGDAAVD